MFDTILLGNCLGFIIVSRFQFAVIVEHCKPCDGSIGSSSTIDFNFNKNHRTPVAVCLTTQTLWELSPSQVSPIQYPPHIQALPALVLLRAPH